MIKMMSATSRFDVIAVSICSILTIPKNSSLKTAKIFITGTAKCVNVNSLMPTLYMSMDGRRVSMVIGVL